MGKQEPVAWLYRHPTDGAYASTFKRHLHAGWTETPLYTRATRPADDGLVADVERLHHTFTEWAALHPNEQPHFPGGIRPFSTGDLRHYVTVLEQAAALRAQSDAEVEQEKDHD